MKFEKRSSNKFSKLVNATKKDTNIRGKVIQTERGVRKGFGELRKEILKVGKPVQFGKQKKQKSSLTRVDINRTIELQRLRGGQLKQQFPQQQSRPQVSSPGRGVTIAPFAPKRIIPKSERPINFFEHGTNEEVYGSDNITFFDSQNARRGQDATGSLFGF